MAGLHMSDGIHMAEIFVTTDSTTIEILDLTIIEISVIADVASEAMYIVHVLTFQYMIAQAFSSC